MTGGGAMIRRQLTKIRSSGEQEPQRLCAWLIRISAGNAGRIMR